MEFLGLDTVNDAILDLGSQLANKLAVPICCMVVYKGYHCFVESNFEFNPNNLVYGKKDGDFLQVSYLAESLMKLGRHLNIRQHPIKGRIIGDTSNPDIYLSQNMLIYKSSIASMDDLITNKRRPSTSTKADPNANPGDGIFFIRNAESIFPIDIEVSQKSRQIKRQRLRPEFLKEYDKKLNPDTLQDGQGGSKNFEQNDFELTEANKELTSNNLRQLIHSLDTMDFLPMDSPGIERVFHEFGVNLRYLG